MIMVIIRLGICPVFIVMLNLVHLYLRMCHNVSSVPEDIISSIQELLIVFPVLLYIPLKRLELPQAMNAKVILIIFCIINLNPLSPSLPLTALCQPHSYSSTGLSPCVSCPSGYYQPLYGSTSCLICTNDSTIEQYCPSKRCRQCVHVYYYFFLEPTSSIAPSTNPTDDEGINVNSLSLFSSSSSSPSLLLYPLHMCFRIIITISLEIGLSTKFNKP